MSALDVSSDQLALGRTRAAERGLGNISFLEASAYEPSLALGQFDLAFCRFLLCHLQRPADALAQMAALLRPGGVLVVQDMVMTSTSTDPPRHAYARFIELAQVLGEALGVDYDLGRRLSGMLHEGGLTDVSASIHQPSFTTGEAKRLWEYTFLEAAPGAAAAGVIDDDECEALAAEFAAIGADEAILVVQPALIAVSGTMRAA